MSRHTNENPWRLSPSPPSTSTSRVAPQHAIKGDSWRPKPSSSWTPAQSRPSGSSARAREKDEEGRKESYRPRTPPRPHLARERSREREWGRDRRDRSRSREREPRDDRSWAAWKDRREVVDRRVDERRRDDDRDRGRRSPERDRTRESRDSYRPPVPATRRDPSPRGKRRASPDYGVGRRRSPSYNDRDGLEKERGRSPTTPKRLYVLSREAHSRPYSPSPPRQPPDERKRPLSPAPSDRSKRPRELSPPSARRYRRSPNSHSPNVPLRRDSPRSQPLRSPRNGRSPRRSPSPRRWNRDPSPSPRRERPRSKSPQEPPGKRQSWGTRRDDPPAAPESYRPQNGHRSPSPPKRRTSLQQFFEDAIVPTGPRRSISPKKPNGDRPSAVAMDRVGSSGSGKSIPLGPRATHGGGSTNAREYLDRIAANEREYASHLSTIAPYINAAFQSWVSQNAPALPEFLRHYFGRAPTMEETEQIESLLEMKQKLGRDERELRVLAEEAGEAIGNSHWSPPVRRRSRSPVKPSVNELPLTRNRYANGNGNAVSEPPPPERKVLAPGEVYERLNCVGEGTYGKVYKARNAITGQFVALKRIRMEGEKDGFPVTAMREIKLLQGLRHDNVIRLIEMMVSKGSVYMVFEYMDHDLTGLLSHPSVSFSPANLKSLNYQMLSGLAYLHHKGILHRDMKGSNILLNAAGELKLGDFGLARVYAKHRVQDYTNRVITLWYRSPELLLGETAYGPEVDMWSAGCIMLELFVTKPVFQGNDEIHQLEVIYGIMGTPGGDWPGVKELPWYELVKPKEALPNKFRESFGKWLSPAALDLAEGLLFFDPRRRLSATSALKTAYFTTEEPGMEVPKQLLHLGDYHEMDVKAERHRRRKESGDSK